MTYRSGLSFDVLVDWVEGRLDTNKSAEVERAVAAADSSVRADIEWIHRFIEAGQSMPMIDPPEEVKHSVRDAFARRTSPWAAGAFVDTTLIFDSHASVSAAGMRSKNSTRSRHLIFQADDHEVSLETLDQDDGHMSSSGHVSTPVDDDVRPELIFTSMRHVRHITRCYVDGTFDLEALSPDVDEIWVDSGETRLRLQIPQRSWVCHDS